VLYFNPASSEACSVHCEACSVHCEACLVLYPINKNGEVGHFTVSSSFHSSLVVISILLGYGAASLGQWCLKNIRNDLCSDAVSYHTRTESTRMLCLV